MVWNILILIPKQSRAKKYFMWFKKKFNSPTLWHPGAYHASFASTGVTKKALENETTITKNQKASILQKNIHLVNNSVRNVLCLK